MIHEPRIQLIPANTLQAGDALVVDIDPRLPPLSDEQFATLCNKFRQFVPADVCIIATRGATLSVLRVDQPATPEPATEPTMVTPTTGQEIRPPTDATSDEDGDADEPDTELFTEIAPVMRLPSLPEPVPATEPTATTEQV